MNNDYSFLAKSYKYIGPYKAEFVSLKDGSVTLKIHSEVYKKAFIYSRGGRWYTRVYFNKKEHRKTTDYNADPPTVNNIAPALELLHHRYEVLTGRKQEEERHLSTDGMTIPELVEGYFNVYSSQISAHSLRHHTSAIRAFLSENVEASEENIYYAVTNALNSGKRSYDTNKKLLVYVNRICEWALSRKLIVSNPIPAIQKGLPAPSNREKGKNTRKLPKPEIMIKAMDLLNQSRQEIKPAYYNVGVRNIIGRNASITKTEREWEFWGRFLKIMDITAMRPIELVRLKQSAVSEDGFTIDGKNGLREFPFYEEYFSGLKELLLRQMDSVPNRFKDPKVFQGIQVVTTRGFEEPKLHTPNKLFKTLQVIAGARENFYTLYTIRANTINRWDKVFMFDPQLIDMLADNSPRIRNKHYNAHNQLSDVFRRLKSS
ncbi:MAG: hypothetical protein Kapaf2KO_21880 [Candidatus Kapaibacteriales bacterium]